jgi:hypothetical protein
MPASVDWIKKAVEKPGSFTNYCKHKYHTKGVTEKCIHAAEHSRSATTRHRAQLAETLRKMHHHRHK